MKYEEIKNIEAGRNLDKLVAEFVMGGFVKDPDAFSRKAEVWYWMHSSGAVQGLPYPVDDTDKKYSHAWKPFLPSTKIDDAWKVLERVREIDSYWCPNIWWDDMDGLAVPNWMCAFEYYGENPKNYSVFADGDENVCVAICRAALMLVHNARL